MVEVVWTEAALRNVREIIEYVSTDSMMRAERLQERLMDAPDILVHTPRIGRRVPEFRRDNLRELLTVRPYRILYLIEEEECKIVAVIHGKRDLHKAMHEEEIDEP